MNWLTDKSPVSNWAILTLVVTSIYAIGHWEGVWP